MSDDGLRLHPAAAVSDQSEKLEADLRDLCREAVALGASGAVVIDAHSIVVDPRVRLKCRIPLCASYGVNLMCPPNVMSPADFAEALSRYWRAVLIRVDIPFSESQTGLIEQTESLGQLRNHGNLRPTLAAAAKALISIISRLEAQCFKLGYSFAAGLGAGSCKLCEECVGQATEQPCRYPFEARPSMEAVGIDVFATARNAGISLSRSALDGVCWVGLVLVS